MNALNAKVKAPTLNIDPVRFFRWNHVVYTKPMVSDFLGFVIWLVKDDWFTVRIEGEEFEIRIAFDGYMGFIAATKAYNGEEDHLNINHSFNSRADALAGLVEQLSENILSKQTNP